MKTFLVEREREREREREKEKERSHLLNEKINVPSSPPPTPLPEMSLLISSNQAVVSSEEKNGAKRILIFD